MKKREPYFEIDAQAEPDLIPEKQLLLAIISRAVLDCTEYTREYRIPKIRNTAHNWIFSRNTGEWSFFWCCQLTDRCPLRIMEYVKRNLLPQLFSN